MPQGSSDERPSGVEQPDVLSWIMGDAQITTSQLTAAGKRAILLRALRLAVPKNSKGFRTLEAHGAHYTKARNLRESMALRFGYMDSTTAPQYAIVAALWNFPSPQPAMRFDDPHRVDDELARSRHLLVCRSEKFYVWEIVWKQLKLPRGESLASTWRSASTWQAENHSLLLLDEGQLERLLETWVNPEEDGDLLTKALHGLHLLEQENMDHVQDRYDETLRRYQRAQEMRQRLGLSF